MSSAASTVGTRPIWRECLLSWRFVSNDRWTTVVPASMFLAAGAVHSSAPPIVLGVRVALGLLYVYLYIYGFALTNQINAIAEDRVNKPFRPLVAGDCTRQGAIVRAAVVLAVFPVLGWAMGVGQWAILWEAVYLLYNCGGMARYWVAKDLIMGIGVFAQLAASWQLVTAPTALSIRWCLTLAVAITLLIPMQDLRDVSGDLAVGRRTFPISVGMRAARVYLALGFAALPVAVHVLLLGAGRPHRVVWPVECLLAGLNLTTAVRVATMRKPEQDHQSYRLFEYWYSLILALAVIVLNG